MTFFVGKTGSGKTEQLYGQMIDASETKSRRQLLIVPEQSTLDAQYDLIEKHPRHCISNIEVLSFQRLAYRLGDELAMAGQILLSEPGKEMLIRRLIESDKETFPFLSRHSRKKGYMTELSRLLSEFSRYAIDEQSLRNITEQLEESVLKMKLQDLGQLIATFDNYTKDRYMSGDTVMDRLVARCHDSEFLRNSDVYIDGFFGFTPIQYQLIEKMMSTAVSMTMAITIEPEMMQTETDESHLYYESISTLNRLRNIAYNIPEGDIDTRVFSGLDQFSVREVLKDNLYQYPYEPWQEKVKNLWITRCSSDKMEMSYLRDSILKLVREKGYHYRDIAVLTGAMDRHEQILTEKLDEGNIPYFVDSKKQAVTNEGVRFVLTLVNLYRRKLNFDSVFEYLKSDFVSEPQEVLDHMENYVLRYGIRGWHQWEKVWQYRLPGITMETEAPYALGLLQDVNDLRAAFIQRLMPYRIMRKATVKEHVTSLYENLVAHRFEEQLQTKKDRLLEEDKPDRSRAYGQVYRKTMDLLDQLCEMSDESLLDYNEFYSLLEAGMEGLELGLVPAAVDQVIIGDLTRSRIRTRKACFIIGVNEGVVPAVKEGMGLITDEERQRLETMGMTLAPTARQTLFREQFYIYMALLNYRERLYLSYSTTDESGKGSRPSHLIQMLRSILPSLVVLDADDLYEDNREGTAPAVAFNNLIKDIQKDKKPDMKAKRWLESHPYWQEKTLAAYKALETRQQGAKLSEESSMGLYGLRLDNSVSRLEQFARCPFSHFMTYGLGIKEREGFEITMPHLGMIFHRVIELFSKRLIQRDMDWSQVTDRLRRQWVDELIDEVLEEDIYSVFFDNERNKYRIKRLKAMINRALQTIGYQITRGAFRPSEAEWHFDGTTHPLKSLNIPLDGERKMALRGTIDRVDTHQIQGMEYLTVVDYKSSAHDFDLEELYAGIQLQLVVYMNAASEIKSQSGSQTKPAGMFYFKIDDPFVSNDRELDEAQGEKEILGKLRMKGVVVEDPEVIQSLDSHFTRKSDVIPVSRNKDGSMGRFSKTLSEEEFRRVMTYTDDKVKSLGNAIVTGDIEPHPYKKGKSSACDYCPYNSICQFDERMPECHYREMAPMDKEQIMEAIQTFSNDGQKKEED